MEKQTRFRNQLATISPAPLSAQSVQALARVIWPVGRWRMAVRGLAASNLRSTIRLNAIAHVRAQTIAARMSRNVFSPGQPRLSRAAMAIEASANGRANRVWEILTNSPHLRSVPNTRPLSGQSRPLVNAHPLRSLTQQNNRVTDARSGCQRLANEDH